MNYTISPDDDNKKIKPHIRQGPVTRFTPKTATLNLCLMNA